MESNLSIKEILLPWVLAARPKTLTAAFIPVLTGTALAKAVAGSVSFSLTFYAMLAAFFIQIGTNLVNDALDFKKGADTNSRLGPMRVTQSGLLSGQKVLAWGVSCLMIAFLFAVPLMQVGGFPIALLFAVSVVLGYLYTGGPAPLAYVGLGDLFVLLFFGWAAVCGIYYLQTLTVDLKAVLAGAEIGLLATVLIAINNFRDVVEDGRVGKKTLAVRFGKRFARMEIAALVGASFLLNLLWGFTGYKMAAILPFLSLPLGIVVVKTIWQSEPSHAYNRILGMAALLHFMFGLLLSIGFWIG